MYHIPAVIFAGGKSSRMGKDKALLPFGTHTSLSKYQYVKLSKLFTHVYLSTKKQKFDFTCQTITDIKEASSPLVALLSCFSSLPSETVFVLSVDAPLVNKEIITRLYEESILPENKNKDAIIAQSPKGIQPLCGFYRRSILPLAETCHAENNHKLTTLLQKANTLYVPFKEEKPFTNLNTMPQYQDLRESLASSTAHNF
ncbi:MAG TPA: molybdenum cofactor guanylyltransferase MobA [Epsilonproteobacteria bacterium]|nr:molybdenum cofactor guanylyltransferase MobA [Campylobacterota bacterium]